MRAYLNFTKRSLLRFIFLTSIAFLLFYMGYISTILFVFFELLFLLRFIHTKKFIEDKVFNHYPQYKGLPGWGKWVLLFIVYLILFFLFKWFLINVIVEGVFHIPLNDELQGMVEKLRAE